MSTAVRFDHVSKKYMMHHERPRSFQDLALGLFRGRNRNSEEYWVLDDVSFAVERGEAVGLIGRNGAGKSTALKLVSRIVEPTRGNVVVNGRLSALLELGAGFHPELTGRENVFLNGSILGLKRAELRRRLDSIVAFAELERFIDIPVKHYSSGMHVRLGFAVAVHVDPEILVVDEVLAVGDQAFQAKCLKRIEEIRRNGVTILMVSHGLDMIRNLCDRVIWIDQGHVLGEGRADDVTIEYLNDVWKRENSRLVDEVDDSVEVHGQRWGSKEAIITGVSFHDAEGNERRIFQTGESFVARIHYRANVPVVKPAFGVAIYREDGLHVTGPNSAMSNFDLPLIDGAGTMEYRIEGLPLLTGRYQFTAAIYDYLSIHPYDHHHRAYHFQVEAGANVEREGSVHIPCSWEHHCD